MDEVDTKQCFSCFKWLPLLSFSKHKIAPDGLSYVCKGCDAIRGKKYHIKHKAKIAKKGKEYYQKNKGNNIDKKRAAKKKYRVAHPEKSREHNKRYKKKVLATPKGYLSINISRSISKALKGNKAGRHWEDLVGYTVAQLHSRLHQTLPEGYVWQDYLDGKLHIDHKIPVSVFNFEKPEDNDFQRCFALKNLQLLPARENIIKSNKLTKHFQPGLLF